MKRRFHLVAAVLFALSSALLAFGQSSADASGAKPATAPRAPQAISGTGSSPLQVMVNKTILINTEDELKRVSVTDPAIAEAAAVTPHQVMVHGHVPGEVTLILWDQTEKSRSFDLRVDLDPSVVAREIKQLFPTQHIEVASLMNAIVLSGRVSTDKDVERAGRIAEAFSKNVVNLLTFGSEQAEQVMLEVKFAEIDRTASSQLGINLFSTGATNTIGSVTTQQFGSFGKVDLTATTPPAAGLGGGKFTTQQTISDPLNLFLYRPDLHLGAVIKALQEKKILQMLAEPNLLAISGKESSFLAGGEFPFPVVQPSSSGNSVTIQFKEFGVRLKFTPQVLANGNIHLHVQPEVSTLDFADGLNIGGYTVPALSTRRADSEFELQDGQSFAIAGLIDNRLTDNANKVPGLGNLPILGSLFRSKSLQKNKTELVVMVTARRVNANTPSQAMPVFPYPFLDEPVKK